MITCRHLVLGAAIALLPVAAAAQEGEYITVASTTSTEQSGLFGHILPLFEEETGIEVRVVAQGTGQALETGRRGDADVVFVHARELEEAFVEEGYGVERFDVMYNDFVIVGPGDDLAGIADAQHGGAILLQHVDRAAACLRMPRDVGHGFTHQIRQGFFDRWLCVDRSATNGGLHTRRPQHGRRACQLVIQ